MMVLRTMSRRWEDYGWGLVTASAGSEAPHKDWFGGVRSESRQEAVAEGLTGHQQKSSPPLFVSLGGSLKEKGVASTS